MSSDPDFDDAASAWLDSTDAGSPQRLLRELLRDNQEAVLTFASLSRTEAALSIAGMDRNGRLQRAGRLIQPPLGSRARRLMARPVFHWPAAALLTGGMVWSLLHWNHSGTALAGRRPSPVLVRSAPRALPVMNTPSGKLPPADGAYMQLLERLIVPEFSAQGVSLAEALDRLKNDIEGVDATGPEFAADTAFSGDPKVHVHLKYQSAAMLVKVIALQTGTRFQPSGRGYVIATDPKALPPDTDSKERRPRKELTSFLKSQGLGLPDNEAASTSSPEALTAAEIKQVSDVVQAMFGEKPSNVLPAPGDFTITGDARANAMLACLTSFGSGYPPGTWEWTPHVFYLKSPEAVEAFEKLKEGKGQTVSGEDSETMLRELSLMENVEMIAMPALTVRPGTMEKGFAGKESPDPQTKPDNWTGIRFQITSEPRGEHGVLNLHTTQQGIENPEAPVPAISVSEMSTKVTIEDGQTLLLGGLISEQDGETAILVSARRDPPAPQDFPYGIPVAGNPGMVFSPYAEDKGQVDVSGIKRGTKIKCPYTGKIFRVP
jgi:hypothetical protein